MNEMSNRLVSIIIVTMGRGNYLSLCLDSIKKQTYPKLEVMVIDNSQKNLFYCEALNRGIKQSKGSFILCLNDDVILDEKFIEEGLRGFNSNGKVGMVSGKILRYDKKTIDSTGLFLTLWRTAKERGYGRKDKGQFEKEGYIFGVNGAVAFYRKETLEYIKVNSDYFDPDFHIFYEDLDIAWKAQNFGWKGYYIPQAIAYHARGGTVRTDNGIGRSSYARKYLSDELHVDLIKNRYFTIIKNESLFGFILHFFYVALYDFIIWSYILIFRPQLIKIFLSNLDYLKCALKKRNRGWRG